MATSTKLQKEHTNGLRSLPPPRLMPRPTAVSAARAARSASNRKLVPPATNGSKCPFRKTQSINGGTAVIDKKLSLSSLADEVMAKVPSNDQPMEISGNNDEFFDQFLVSPSDSENCADSNTNFDMEQNSATPAENDDAKLEFLARQNDFYEMKKELDIKQQAVLQAFEKLRVLKELLANAGETGTGEPFLHELLIINVGDWANEEVMKLCRDAVAGSDKTATEIIQTTDFIDESTVLDVNGSVKQMSNYYADLCLRAFTSRQELIDWAKGLIDIDNKEAEERIAVFNMQGLKLCEELRELKSQADETTEAVSHISRESLRERNVLFTVGQSLVREVSRLRLDFEALHTDKNKICCPVPDNAIVVSKESAQEKDKILHLELQLKMSRNRLSKMDRQIRESESIIANLNGTVKNLQDQYRQKECQFEMRIKKMKDSLKAVETSSGLVAQQRDALQSELMSVRGQMETLNGQIITYQEDFNELSAHLNAQKENALREEKMRKIAEDKLKEALERLSKKETQFQQTQEELELAAEKHRELSSRLHATVNTLKMMEDELAGCKRDKIRFLESLTKISETANKVGIQQKLAAELLNKEEIISKLQSQLREVTKHNELKEQKLIQYEEYAKELQAKNGLESVANNEDSNSNRMQDQKDEIMRLKMELLDADHRNEEMTEALAQKERQLEQQEKTSRAQARVIKVREDLISILKTKEIEQNQAMVTLQQDLERRIRIVDEVNKQIAGKANEIQELFGTLDSKQQQINRLEKIILALEEQQRRAQMQRTRQELKISTLEHEIAACGQKARRFIFF